MRKKIRILDYTEERDEQFMTLMTSHSERMPAAVEKLVQPGPGPEMRAEMERRLDNTEHELKEIKAMLTGLVGAVGRLGQAGSDSG